MLSILSTYLFTVSFAPTSLFGDVNFRKFAHMAIADIGCYNDSKKQMVGADGVACSLMYMILFYHRMWPIAGGLALLDLAYYGPYGIGAPATAAFAALTLL